ncbi:hypothetical protein [Candidatus Palauibacter sp.]|uniref:hypothetical protein n=1 Tax=Candidatus Palauibacter sp. TaxID=3101350 RepID=UPI003B522BA2
MIRAATTLLSLLWAGSVAAQTSELRLVEELRLGRVDGSGPDVFAEIHDLALDSSGRIYVLDPGWRDVRLFDRDGRFIRRLAPEGEGPGERRHRPQFPARVTWDDHRARLWIDDRRFLSVLDSLGVEHARDTYMPDFPRDRGHPTGVVVAVDREGRVYEQQYRSTGDTVYSYAARGQATPGREISGDTLHIDTRALVQRGSPQTSRSEGGTMRVTFFAPERDHIAWSISPEGTVWLADLDEPRLHELTMVGDTLSTLDILRKDLSELDVSPEGWFWARRMADSDESVWDVLDNCGVHVGSASVPYTVTVTEVGSAGVIHVVASDQLDINSVVRLRLDAEVFRRSC